MICSLSTKQWSTMKIDKAITLLLMKSCLCVSILWFTFHMSLLLVICRFVIYIFKLNLVGTYRIKAKMIKYQNIHFIIYVFHKKSYYKISIYTINQLLHKATNKNSYFTLILHSNSVFYQHSQHYSSPPEGFCRFSSVKEIL